MRHAGTYLVGVGLFSRTDNSSRGSEVKSARTISRGLKSRDCRTTHSLRSVAEEMVDTQHTFMWSNPIYY